MEKQSKQLDTVLGIAVFAGLVAGFAGLLGALIAFFSSDWIGVGVCLGAAALAFGLLTNGILRG